VPIEHEKSKDSSEYMSWRQTFATTPDSIAHGCGPTGSEAAVGIRKLYPLPECLRQPDLDGVR